MQDLPRCGSSVEWTAALRDVLRLAQAGSVAGADRDRVRHHVLEEIRAINALIGTYNLCVPVIHVQLSPLEAKEELRRAHAGTP